MSSPENATPPNAASPAPTPAPAPAPPVASPDAIPVYRSPLRVPIVVASGLLTTAVALGIGSFLDHVSDGKFHIMGWFANGIIPAGAILIGIAAAVGYMIAALYLGTRIGGKLLVVIGITTLLAYFGAYYWEFWYEGPLVLKTTGERVGFWHYFDINTRAIYFVSSRGSAPQGPQEGLGALGYGVRLLELVGFMGGTIALPLILKSKRYCAHCEQYQRTVTFATMPASKPPKKTMGFISPRKVVFDDEDNAIMAGSLEVVKKLTEFAAAENGAEFKTIVESHKPRTKESNKLPRRLSLFFSRCDQCGRGVFHPTIIAGIDGKNAQQVVILTQDITARAGDQILPRKRAGLCPACGYDLRGSAASPNCPECGAARVA